MVMVARLSFWGFFVFGPKMRGTHPFFKTGILVDPSLASAKGHNFVRSRYEFARKEVKAEQFGRHFGSSSP